MPEYGTAFPDALSSLEYRCYFGLANSPILTPFVQEWYSSHVAAAELQPLVAYRAPYVEVSEQNSEIIRFIWLRTFDKPVLAEFWRSRDGQWTLKATKLSGQGGYDPGEAEEAVTRLLTASEARRLTALVHESGLLREKPGDCDQGIDGARWIVERLDEHGYDFVDRWSPEDGAMYDFGVFALRLTGWDIEPIY